MPWEMAPAQPLTAPGESLAPRRQELLDFDWRFKPMPAPRLKDAVALTAWQWAKETPDMKEAVFKSDFTASAPEWQKTGTTGMQMQFIGYAWFRTVLPELPGPGRAVSFTHVDDNGEVFLNGKQVGSHSGWAASFVVNLDSAWNDSGPNVLAVRVQNTDGAGGIYGDTSAGHFDTAEVYSAANIDDSSWRVVQLPHDYVVEGGYDSQSDTSHGSMPVHPAWYRKNFTVGAEDAGKCVWLYFEGVFRDAQIYLNGKLVGRHPGGYTSFHIDISDAIRFGESNSLAVYVDPSGFEGWWYEGGGIYRHVWLNVADKTHVTPWGVFVVSDVANVTSKPSAKLRIETCVANRTEAEQLCTLISKVIDPRGHVAGLTTARLMIPPTPNPAEAIQTMLDSKDEDQPGNLHLGTKVEQEVSLASVQLWSLEERHRYTLVTEISRDGKVVDRHAQKFGVRTLRFDPKEGFFLNEKPVKLKGVCNHQDFIGVGIGMPDSLLYYRMQKLQEFGCNAIRCSHNPMTPAMYEACDELGLLVMDENRHPGSSISVKSWVGQPYDNTWHIASMVLRDRNHPSVIMWSMWNEEFAMQNTPFAREMMAALIQAVHKYDPTRPVTCANNSSAAQHAWKGGVAEAEDILGVNYTTEDYDILPRDFPDRMIYGSEIGSNCECRGIYATDYQAAHLTSYMAPDETWQPIGSRPHVAGGFYWTGFDYRGEPTPFGWPEINSNFGFLDMCGFPKDQAFYWKAWWRRDQPLVHIFPHWNWPAKIGRNVPVWCFSNCDEVELFLNGRSLGKKAMPEFRHLQWDNVFYEPGRLEAKGFVKGKRVAHKIIDTTGVPAAVKLRPHRARLRADGQDTVTVAVEIRDHQGRVVPTAANQVHFEIRGAGALAGVGNGDPSCQEPNQADFRSAFNGYCMVLVRANRRPGAIYLTAHAEGLAHASVRLSSSKM